MLLDQVVQAEQPARAPRGRGARAAPPTAGSPPRLADAADVQLPLLSLTPPTGPRGGRDETEAQALVCAQQAAVSVLRCSFRTPIDSRSEFDALFIMGRWRLLSFMAGMNRAFVWIMCLVLRRKRALVNPCSHVIVLFNRKVYNVSVSRVSWPRLRLHKPNERLESTTHVMDMFPRSVLTALGRRLSASAFEREPTRALVGTGPPADAAPVVPKHDVPQAQSREQGGAAGAEGVAARPCRVQGCRRR